MSPREAILALNLLPSFGPVRITRLLEHFGDAENVLSASENKLQRVDGIGPETAKIISRWQDHEVQVHHHFHLTENRKR